MPTTKWLLLFFFSLQLTAYAEDHGGGHEEKPAEEHGAPASAAAVPVVNKTPWVEVEAKIQELSAKIKSKQTNLSHLFEEKNHLANNSSELKVKVQEIVKEHAEMRKLAEDYEKQVNLLKYRFPERNAKTGRKYDRFEIKSVDDMEQAMGVDGKLTRNIRKVRSQYQLQNTKPETNSHVEVMPKNLKKTEGSIEESGSIILQK